MMLKEEASFVARERGNERVVGYSLNSFKLQ